MTRQKFLFRSGKVNVQTDADMVMETTATSMTENNEVVEFESEGLAFWRNYSRHGIDGNKAWFVFHKGEIVVKNPDVEIRNKMIAVATSLKAKVQGDEGEEYTGIEPVRKKLWWNFWL